MLLEHLVQLAHGHLDAIAHRLDRSIGLLPQLHIERLQSPVHVVGHRQDVARESRNAVGARVRDLASGASAKVLHLGKDAQQLVLYSAATRA